MSWTELFETLVYGFLSSTNVATNELRLRGCEGHGSDSENTHGNI